MSREEGYSIFGVSSDCDKIIKMGKETGRQLTVTDENFLELMSRAATQLTQILL